MTSSYKHSESFALLKRAEETISGNLTTNQYCKILDTYLLEAVTPIMTATNYYDGYVGKMLSWQSENFRRKLSMSKEIDLASLSILFLVSSDPIVKLGVWKTLKLDRMLILESLRNFLQVTSRYVEANNCTLPVPVGYDPYEYWTSVSNDIEANLGCSGSLMPVIQQCEYWLHQATEFKRMILEKYIRFCLMQAKTSYVTYFNHEIDLDDIIQSYIVAASRAIDKCDADQGVLTTHIMNWFLTARNFLNKRRTQDSSLHLESLDSVRESTSEDDATPDVSPADDIDYIRAVARMADPKGTGRYYLGIEERLPISQRKLLNTLNPA